MFRLNKPQVRMPSMKLTAALLALALPCLAAGAAPAAEPPPIAVMSAFQPEWTALQAALTDRKDEVINGTTFATGRLAGKPVVLFLSGVSMVNAAMTTQLAIDRFGVGRIVFSGIAGGVDPGLSIGDVVVAGQWGQYLEAVFARETPDGWKLPSYMGPAPFANFGMIFPENTEIARGGDKPEERFWFPADPAMLEVAKRVAGEVKLERCAAAEHCLDHAPEIVVGGNGVSGQAFVDNAAFRAWAFATFEAKVLDMESAAVAHVAYANQVPFIVFRSLSDLAGGGEGENQMGTFFQIAADNSATVVEAFLKALP
jgi:adenosylhomocysteine nucleosidase